MAICTKKTLGQEWQKEMERASWVFVGSLVWKKKKQKKQKKTIEIENRFVLWLDFGNTKLGW